MSTREEALLARARAWIADDPDPVTAAELTALLERAAGEGSGDADEAAAADLASRFEGPLAFGTAGLRGAIGAGEHRMNRAVVIRAAAGLAAFLAESLPEQTPRVVIGYDARRGSAQFALDTAAVVTAAGGEALVMPALWPTPVLAFAVRHLGADAGVMVTASHNPPADNGYKVYLGGRVVTGAGQGAQIVAPFDVLIAQKIAAVASVAQTPRAEAGWHVLGEEIHEAYLARVDAVAGRASADEAGLRIVHTPMHGVAGGTTVAALAQAGFGDVHVVPEQAEPDPDFPTVAFPNPEEPGALDLAFALARDVEADLVLANDPDGDRCAAAIPDPYAAGGWRALTGDEVGSLLGEQAAALAAPGDVLASSLVSSSLLPRIAAAHGLEHRATLTGFKWISRVARLAYGYEEALGYCVDPAGVRDKDGVSAAVRLALLAGRLRAQGRTITDALDDLALAHGVVATSPLSLRVTDLALIGEAMARLRTNAPATLAGAPVSRTVDLATGLHVPTPEGGYHLPPTDGLWFETSDGVRAVVRPSGTEPKLKAYLEVVEPVDGPRDLAAAKARAAQRVSALRSDMAAAIGL